MTRQVDILYRRWLSKLSYRRPGYELRWVDGSGLVIAMETTDSNDGSPQEQSFGFGYPPHPTEGFTGWVFQCLMIHAFHEIGEFFLVNGERYFHPHDDGMLKMAEMLGDTKVADLTKVNH